MSLHDLILAYLVTMMAGLSAAAIYAEMRRRRFEPSHNEDNIL